MDKKVKYYKAINWRCYIYENLKHSPHEQRYRSELRFELDAIITVVMYDTELTLTDKKKIGSYISRVDNKL